ncbi:hypothetical protein AOLI_G00295410 [Acnodon oligacanthus]
MPLATDTHITRRHLPILGGKSFSTSLKMMLIASQKCLSCAKTHRLKVERNLPRICLGLAPVILHLWPQPHIRPAFSAFADSVFVLLLAIKHESSQRAMGLCKSSAFSPLTIKEAISIQTSQPAPGLHAAIGSVVRHCHSLPLHHHNSVRARKYLYHNRSCPLGLFFSPSLSLALSFHSAKD